MGTIPLLHVHSNFEAGFSYDQDFIDFAKVHLVCDASNYDSFNKKLKYVTDNYEDVMRDILNEPFIQRYFNKSFYEKHMHAAVIAD
jgi:hypothetical protein